MSADTTIENDPLGHTRHRINSQIPPCKPSSLLKAHRYSLPDADLTLPARLDKVPYSRLAKLVVRRRYGRAASLVAHKRLQLFKLATRGYAVRPCYSTAVDLRETAGFRCSCVALADRNTCRQGSVRAGGFVTADVQDTASVSTAEFMVLFRSNERMYSVVYSSCLFVFHLSSALFALQGPVS